VWSKLSDNLCIYIRWKEDTNERLGPESGKINGQYKLSHYKHVNKNVERQLLLKLWSNLGIYYFSILYIK